MNQWYFPTSEEAEVADILRPHFAGYAWDKIVTFHQQLQPHAIVDVLRQSVKGNEDVLGKIVAYSQDLENLDTISEVVRDFWQEQDSYDRFRSGMDRIKKILNKNPTSGDLLTRIITDKDLLNHKGLLDFACYYFSKWYYRERHVERVDRRLLFLNPTLEFLKKLDRECLEQYFSPSDCSRPDILALLCLVLGVATQDNKKILHLRGLDWYAVDLFEVVEDHSENSYVLIGALQVLNRFNCNARRRRAESISRIFADIQIHPHPRDDSCAENVAFLLRRLEYKVEQIKNRFQRMC